VSQGQVEPFDGDRSKDGLLLDPLAIPRWNAAMQTVVNCPNCRAQVTVDTDPSRSTTFTCPSCNKAFHVTPQGVAAMLPAAPLPMPYPSVRPVSGVKGIRE
jgi:uncharacterized protein YbaR (Trm112 family)